MLTGIEIANSGMLIGFDDKYIQMQGVDIRIDKINKIKKGSMGAIPKEGKTVLPQYEAIEPMHYKNGDNRIFGWMLAPGVYDIEFIEGVKVDSTHMMKPKTRSSLVRCGARIDSGIFDAGFESEHCGAMLYVDNPIVIEKGSRVAQMVCFESNEVDNLYNGQYQRDCQRG